MARTPVFGRSPSLVLKASETWHRRCPIITFGYNRRESDELTFGTERVAGGCWYG
jgi:hypothetical protein